MQVTIKDGNLIIAVPLQTPTPSKSGSKNGGIAKNLVVATTHGNCKTDVEVNGKKVTIGLNAYIPAQ